MLVPAILVLASLLLSALFSGAEIAFLSASKLVVELKKNKGSRQGKILAGFFEKQSDFIASMLVGNNIALVVFSTLMARSLSSLFESTPIESSGLLILLNTICITVVVLVFGEYLPKTLFRVYADQVLFLLAYPLAFLRFLLAAPTWLVMGLAKIVLKAFKDTEVEEDGPFNRLDLEHFIKSTRPDGNDDHIDTELFERALRLRDVRVRDCMVPRPEIEALDRTASIEELIELFKETNLSRVLIYNNDIDDILGYVHHQQLLKEPDSIDSIIMDISIFPESMKVRDLLNEFVKKRQNIACIVDEFGGTAGVITLEDILEEIFGEIEDEHDQEEYIEEQLSETEYLLSGRLEISYLNEKYPNLNLPEGEYTTLSGYLVMTTASIPEQGAEIQLGNYQFVFESVSDTKIETVRVFVLPGEL
jgi:putative hemolysin